VPADLFDESAGQRRYSQALPMRGDAGTVRGVSEEVRKQAEHSYFAGPGPPLIFCCLHYHY
jgi:hypothetical protein